MALRLPLEGMQPRSACGAPRQSPMHSPRLLPRRSPQPPRRRSPRQRCEEGAQFMFDQDRCYVQSLEETLAAPSATTEEVASAAASALGAALESSPMGCWLGDLARGCGLGDVRAPHVKTRAAAPIWPTAAPKAIGGPQLGAGDSDFSEERFSAQSTGCSTARADAHPWRRSSLPKTCPRTTSRCLSCTQSL